MRRLGAARRAYPHCVGVRRSIGVACVAVGLGCAPAAPTREATTSTQPFHRPTPVARATAAAPAPFVIAAAPPAAGDVGTGAMLWLVAAADDGRWAIVCEVREDTNRDGKVSTWWGHHGELFDDDPAPYWIRGHGAGEELEEMVGVDPARRWLVVMQRGAMVLVDTRSDARVALRGADTRYEHGVFGGARVAFDPAGQHLLYLRSPAAAGGRPSIVVRRLADGDERTIDPGNGSVARVTVTGRWVMSEVDDPQPGTTRNLRSGRSGPDHTVGGRRCRSDRPQEPATTETRWAPLGGSVATARKGAVTAVGDALAVREADGALSLVTPEATVPIAPAACQGAVLARWHAQRAVLHACPGPDGELAELRLWQGAATPPTTQTLDVKVDIRPGEYAEIGRWGDGRFAVVRTAGDAAFLVDLATGRTRAADSSYAIATHGTKVLLHRPAGPLSTYDLTTGAWVDLPGASPDMMESDQRGRLFAAGRRIESDDEPLGQLVDLETSTVIGTFPGPALAVSSGGWVLSPKRATPPSTASIVGPLRWVRPSPQR